MELTNEDEGKHVINRDGEQVGVVSEVEGTRAHVEPDPGVTETIKSKLGWADTDEEMYSIGESDVESINDQEVHLNR
jgi:hypothetical protein